MLHARALRNRHAAETRFSKRSHSCRRSGHTLVATRPVCQMPHCRPLTCQDHSSIVGTATALLIDATIKTCVMSFQLCKNHAFRIFYVCNLHYSHHAPLHNAYHSVLLPANRASTFLWSRRRSRNRGGSVGCHLAGRVSSDAGSTRTIFPIMAPAIPWWSSTCRRCIMQPVGFYLQYLSNASSAFSAQDLRQIGPLLRSPATASCNGRPLILHPQIPSSGTKGTSEFRHGPPVQRHETPCLYGSLASHPKCQCGFSPLEPCLHQNLRHSDQLGAPDGSLRFLLS